MSFESLDRKIWKLWKQGKSLTEIVDYIAEYTHWSRYMALVHLVRYLYGEKNVKLSHRVLKRAFDSTKDDFDSEDAGAAWKFLLEKVGLSD